MFWERRSIARHGRFLIWRRIRSGKECLHFE
jgi:hypothetical protein